MLTLECFWDVTRLGDITGAISMIPIQFHFEEHFTILVNGDIFAVLLEDVEKMLRMFFSNTFDPKVIHT